MISLAQTGALLTPRHFVFAARWALGLGVALVAVLTLSPSFVGAERQFGLTDKAAHALAFYGLMNLALMAAPHIRRNDMAFGLLMFAAGIELAQGLIGRQASVIDMAANCVGVLAVIVPAEIERLRTLARSAPDESLAILAARDARGGAGQTEVKHGIAA
jgi:VanZ family protein